MNCACRAARRHRRLGRLVPPGGPGSKDDSGRARARATGRGGRPPARGSGCRAPGRAACAGRSRCAARRRNAASPPSGRTPPPPRQCASGAPRHGHRIRRPGCGALRARPDRNATPLRYRADGQRGWQPPRPRRRRTRPRSAARAWRRGSPRPFPKRRRARLARATPRQP